jgi:hypothetical protein
MDPEVPKNPNPSIAADAVDDNHPAKKLEQLLHLLAPILASAVAERMMRPAPPARPALLARTALAVADRMMRSGRALRALVVAYRGELPAYDEPAFFGPPPMPFGGSATDVRHATANGVPNVRTSVEERTSP